MRKYFAIDIGGTKVKYGIVSESGEILEKGIMDTNGCLGVENLLNRIDILIKQSGRNISGIAFSCSGQIDSKKGKVIGGTPIIKDWVGTEIKQRYEEKYKIPCEVENDANCAGLGELWKGSAIGEKDFLNLTIGTGIGGAIIINGDIYTGNIGIAGEFGHFQIEKNGEICSCGKKGCYEKYASTKSLEMNVEKKINRKMSGKEIFMEVKRENEQILEIFNQWIDSITDGLATLIQIFNPKLIVIGGGVSEQKDDFLKALKESLQLKVDKNYLEGFSIKLAKCGNDAGMLGAVYNLIKKNTSSL